MVESIKQRIKERAGIGASGNLYRGGEFSYPTIEADTVEVFYVEEGEDAVDDARPSSPRSAGLTVTRTDTRSVAGGLSSRVAGSMKFAQNLSAVGATLVFDPSDIQPTPNPIEYTLDWMDDHPGLLARIDSLSTGEVRSANDGRLLGLTWEGNGIHKSKRANMEFTATSDTYSTEQEWFAYTDRLDLEGAMIGGLSVVHQQRSTGGSIQGALADREGFKMGSVGRRTSVTSMSTQEQAEALAPLVSQDSTPIRETGAPYWVVVVEDDREWKSNGGIERSEFVLASNGEETVRDPVQLPEWVPV
jgi:hypothetical protein